MKKQLEYLDFNENSETRYLLVEVKREELEVMWRNIICFV